MKTFHDICRMSQEEVKAYMKDYLTSRKYNVVDEDGFLYAKGDVPVLLVAHMDTVHKEKCVHIIEKDGKISSPQGIGGDDRCGIFIIMNVVKNFHCSVLLCEDEECGGIGARKFTKTDYINNLDVNFMVEVDRRGSNDAVFYSCDNQEFIDFVTDVTGFKTAPGSFTDISTLMPAAKISGVNLSSGYYSAHTLNEYVVYEEMMDTAGVVEILVKEECEKPFEYVAKAYKPTKYSLEPDYGHSYGGGMDYYMNLFDKPYIHEDFQSSHEDEPSPYKDTALANMAMSDTELELEVVAGDEGIGEEVYRSQGNTKAECWMKMFLENPDLCFNDIVDFIWG